MKLQANPQKTRRTRYFYHTPGRDGVDDTFDIVSVMTGRLVASVPYWDEIEGEEESARRDADLLVEGLNALVSYGGRLHGDFLEQAIPEHPPIPVSVDGEPLEPLPPSWTEIPIPGLSWNVENVLKMRPDLHREEAYGVLHEVAAIANFGRHICPEIIKAVADEMFTVLEPSKIPC